MEQAMTSRLYLFDFLDRGTRSIQNPDDSCRLLPYMKKMENISIKTKNLFVICEKLQMNVNS